MCTERITCYKNLFFLNKSVHRIRPMKIRNKQKLKRLISDRHLLFIPCRNADKIPVYDLFQETERTSRSDHLHLRTIIEKAFYASGMIRLCMTYNKIIDFPNVDHFLKMFQIFVKKLRFCSLEKNCFVPRLHHIRIISCTEFRIHDNIKYSELIVNNTCPIKIIS